MAAQEAFGTLFIQAITLPQYTVWYSIFDCIADTTLVAQKNLMFLKLHIALNKTLHWFFNGIGNITLASGYGNLLHIPMLEAAGRFSGGNLYISLDIALNPDTVKNIHKDMPLLHTLLTAVDKGFPYVMGDKAISLTPTMRHIIAEIVQLNYTDKNQRLYAEQNIRWLVFSVLHEANPLQEHRHLDANLLQAVKEEIEKSLRYQPDPGMLAAKFNCSSSKLVKDFKTFFGLTMHAYWQQYRMSEAARLLLHTNKRIKDITGEMGFGNEPGNFSRIFKLYYRLPPAQYRRRSRMND